MLSNLKTWHLLLLLVILGLVFTLYLSLAGSPTRQSGDVINQMTAFVGGKFEASGVAAVPGTDGVLFVDNGRSRAGLLDEPRPERQAGRSR